MDRWIYFSSDSGNRESHDSGIVDDKQPDGKTSRRKNFFRSPHVDDDLSRDGPISDGGKGRVG